jgi:tetratricopeptide (TPR) repeat protein
MGRSDQRPSERPSDGHGQDTTTQRLRLQSQIDFEIDLFSRILDVDPLYADVLRIQADNLAAKGQWHRALQLDRRLVRLLPDRPIPWYNLACSYAVLGMIDPAFDSLEHALRLGYRHLKHLLRDPDLAPLRRDPRFDPTLRRALTGGRQS